MVEWSTYWTGFDKTLILSITKVDTVVIIETDIRVYTYILWKHIKLLCINQRRQVYYIHITYTLIFSNCNIVYILLFFYIWYWKNGFLNKTIVRFLCNLLTLHIRFYHPKAIIGAGTYYIYELYLTILAHLVFLTARVTMSRLYDLFDSKGSEFATLGLDYCSHHRPAQLTGRSRINSIMVL